MNFKKQSIRLACLFICLVLLAVFIPSPAYAASYADCPSPAFGWGVSVSWVNGRAIGNKKGIGGCNNTGSKYACSYKFTDSFTHSLTISSAIANETSFGVNYSTGALSGSLGAAISSKYSVENNFTRTYSQVYSTTVPAYQNLTLYSQAYGTVVTVYAIWHTAFIHGTQLNGTIKVPTYQKFVPVWG